MRFDRTRRRRHIGGWSVPRRGVHRDCPDVSRSYCAPAPRRMRVETSTACVWPSARVPSGSVRRTTRRGRLANRRPGPGRHRASWSRSGVAWPALRKASPPDIMHAESACCARSWAAWRGGTIGCPRRKARSRWRRRSCGEGGPTTRGLRSRTRGAAQAAPGTSASCCRWRPSRGAPPSIRCTWTRRRWSCTRPLRRREARVGTRPSGNHRLSWPGVSAGVGAGMPRGRSCPRSAPTG